MVEQRVGQSIEFQRYRPEPHGTVLTKQSFLQDFSHEALSASEVFTAVMHLEAGYVGRQVADLFKYAPVDAKKTVVIDAFSNLVSGGLILTPYSHLPKFHDEVMHRREAQESLLSDLRESNTEVRVINQPKGIKDKVFPYTGRSHLKISYARKADGQSIAYVHSNNYEDSPSAEISVKFTGGHADKIIDAYDDIINNPPTTDYEKQLTDDLSIFVDSGQPGQSVIMKNGMTLVQNAKSGIYVCSQLPPSGEFAQALSDAHKDGKRVEVLSTKRYLERPVYTDNNIMYGVSALSGVSSFLHGHSYPLFLDPYRNIHAKLIITDPFSDEPTADFGSHNYAVSGVKAGTREVQLRTTDPAIVRALHRRFEDFKLPVQQKNW